MEIPLKRNQSCDVCEISESWMSEAVTLGKKEEKKGSDGGMFVEKKMFKV